MTLLKSPARTYGVAFLLLTTPLSPQFPFSHPQLGFSMTVPAGFLGEGDDIMRVVKPLACFIRPGVADRGWTRLCVEDRGDLPTGGDRMTFTWKGHDLAGTRVHAEEHGREIVMFAALVPLRKATIRLIASAPRGDEASAQAALVTALSTLQGEPKWQSSSERAYRVGDTVGRIGIIILALGVGMWIMQRRRLKNPGTGS